MTSDSREQTARIATVIGSHLRKGDVLALDGELGAGKTVMVTAMAIARGHDGPVTSPTFTIINAYPRIGLCHIDAYRLAGPDELIEAGVEEYLDGDWICAIEWAGRVRDALPPAGLDVTIGFGAARDDRLITVSARGGWDSRAESIISELKRNG